MKIKRQSSSLGKLFYHSEVYLAKKYVNLKIFGLNIYIKLNKGVYNEDIGAIYDYFCHYRVLLDQV